MISPAMLEVVSDASREYIPQTGIEINKSRSGATIGFAMGDLGLNVFFGEGDEPATTSFLPDLQMMPSRDVAKNIHNQMRLTVSLYLFSKLLQKTPNLCPNGIRFKASEETITPLQKWTDDFGEEGIAITNHAGGYSKHGRISLKGLQSLSVNVALGNDSKSPFRKDLKTSMEVLDLTFEDLDIPEFSPGVLEELEESAALFTRTHIRL